MGNYEINKPLNNLFEFIMEEEMVQKQNPLKNFDDALFLSSNIKEKVKSSIVYSQNLYAALCNNTFKRINDPSIKWNCSWREAGEIVASLREEGCYLDWYCSYAHEDNDNFVKEGTITREIKNDIHKLGWEVNNNL